jgi:tRNA threonylcarbamoyladenosine biosynthesis protein TsaB
MKILALDTSTSFSSLALSNGREIIVEYLLNTPRTHSVTLLPMIDKILRETETRIDEINAIAVANGPGSFTGLRIGLATAKGICYGQKIPLVAIPTLMSLANNIVHSGRNICAILDAGRGSVYAAVYSPQLNELIQPQIFTNGEFSKQIKDVILVGPCIDKLDISIRNNFQLTSSHLNYPRAASLIDIIYKKDIKLNYDYQYIANLQPFYIRKSSAEEHFKNKK